MSFYKKVKNRIKNTVANFKSDSNFSFKYACWRIIDEYSSRLGWKKISSPVHAKREKWISVYLEKHLQSVVEEFKDKDNVGCFSENAPIWICWWDGEDVAPALVKQCIKSIKKNAGVHKVCFITKDNYSEYIEIPEYMLQKVAEKKMKLAHLADYIRIALLEKYGGLWIDTTMYCHRVIPEEYFELPFFTCKSEECDCGYLSRMRWVTFCIGGYKNNIVFTFLKRAFEEYWKNHDNAIDYLFFDHLIDIAYNNVPAIKKFIDSVPINNLHRDDLQAAMNEALPGDSFDNIIKDDTVLYKLSWRESYSEKTADGQESVYGHFLNMKTGEK